MSKKSAKHKHHRYTGTCKGTRCQYFTWYFMIQGHISVIFNILIWRCIESYSRESAIDSYASKIRARWLQWLTRLITISILCMHEWLLKWDQCQPTASHICKTVLGLHSQHIHVTYKFLLWSSIWLINFYPSIYVHLVNHWKKKEVMCVCRYIYESYDMELRNDMDFFAIAKSLQNFNSLII